MAAAANIGTSPQEIFAALCAGQESRKPLTAFDPDKYRAAYAYEIDDRPESGGDIPRRATRWLTTVVRQAVADAGLGENLSQVPVLVGTTRGPGSNRRRNNGYRCADVVWLVDQPSCSTGSAVAPSRCLRSSR
jgi:3-oxoacyl-(acyl-carrier-protein) synthase